MSEKWATLTEIDTSWNFSDLMMANSAMDAIDEAQRRARRKAEQ